MKQIYLDNAATTKLDGAVLEAMTPYLTDIYGNASSHHSFGREAMKAIDSAKHDIATVLGCKENEIYFTSGGSESDNWALKGIAMSKKNVGNHIITSKIEHPAIMNTCKYLEKQGFEITYLPVDKNGIVSVSDLENAITDKTILVSIMAANNEIGSLQPIKELSNCAHKHNVLFHTDAVQAMGAIEINVKDLDVDLLSMSAHKFHGPKGIGLLYIRNGIKIDRLIMGGEQQRNMRAGTYDTASIVGLAKALTLATTNISDKADKLVKLRDYFINRVMAEIPYTRLNGHPSLRLPNNANFSFEFIEGESILLLLDLNGIAASSGSACSSGSLEPSHVLLSIGVPVEIAHGSIRFTLGQETTKQDLDYVVEKLKEIVTRLRQMSPLFKAQGEEHNV